MNVLTRSAHPGLLWATILLLGILAAAWSRPGTPESVLGTTHCEGGKPVSWIRPGLDPATRAWVEAHEAVHVAQAERMGCSAFMVHLERPQGILELEAEAYCHDVRVAASRTDAPVEQGAELVVQNLLEDPGYRRVRLLGEDRVRSEVWRACGLAR